MNLRELLKTIQDVGADKGISPTYIVGGTPRDKLLNLIVPGEMNDLDITTGDKTIHNLATELAIEFKKHFTINVKKGDDGHTSIIFPGNKFKLDLSSHFLLPNIDELLLHRGIKSPTDMQREMFSRDFTVNALLMTLDLKKIKDPTKLGLPDIEKKLLKTCLDVDTTLRYNTNRIIRVVYLSAKLDFDVDPNIIKWIEKNKDLVRLSSDNYLMKNIDKAMSKNPDRALHIINRAKLWDVIPMTDSLRPYKKNVVAQLRRNFDVGEGLYENMSKYKSIYDFRKNRRKKRMKEIKRIKDLKLQ